MRPYKEEYSAYMYISLFCRNDDVTLQLMMGYRKGKRVMKRILPMLSDVGCVNNIILYMYMLQHHLIIVLYDL